MDTELVADIKNFPFIQASAHCDYKMQTYINEKLIIKTFVKEIGRSSFKLGHEIVRKGSGELLAYGEIVLVYFDFNQQKSQPLPDDIRSKLETYLK